MMNKHVKVISNDIYATLGFREIVNSLSVSLPVDCCVLILTQCTLMDTYCFLKSKIPLLDCNTKVILISTLFARKLVEGIGIRCIMFIDVQSNYLTVHNKIGAIVQKQLSYIRTNDNDLVISPCENRTMNLLIEGYTTLDICKELGLNKNTISTQKRSVMKKINVQSTQYLVMKLWLMRAIGSCDAPKQETVIAGVQGNREFI